jgi:general secretion pathway protein D
VGIKLEVEPEIYTDDDVGIKLMLEVSNVTGVKETQSGTAYQIGTRSAQTSLRLHNGETQVLGGLIRNSDSDSAQRLPGFGQLPVMGRLFSNHRVEGGKTEVIVTITPHIVRPRAAPDIRNADAWSGSDATVRDRPLRLDPIGALKLGQPKPGPAAVPSPSLPPVRPPINSPARPAAEAVAPARAASEPQVEGAAEPDAKAPVAAPPPAAPASAPAPGNARLPMVMPRALPGSSDRQIGTIPALPQRQPPVPADPASAPGQ